MHLHANSMNILSYRLQAETLALRRASGLEPADHRRKLQRSALELHALAGNGSMVRQWDGDARRQPGRDTPRAMRAFLGAATSGDSEPEEQTVSLWA